MLVLGLLLLILLLLLLVHNGTVGRLGRLAKVEEEARFGGLVVAAPLVFAAQLLLLVVGRV